MQHQQPLQHPLSSLQKQAQRCLQPHQQPQQPPPVYRQQRWQPRTPHELLPQQCLHAQVLTSPLPPQQQDRSHVGSSLLPSLQSLRRERCLLHRETQSQKHHARHAPLLLLVPSSIHQMRLLRVDFFAGRCHFECQIHGHGRHATVEIRNFRRVGLSCFCYSVSLQAVLLAHLFRGPSCLGCSRAAP